MTNEARQPWHSYEDSSKYDSLFPLLPQYIVRQTLGIHNLRVGLDREPDSELRQNLLAAMAAYRGRIGLDYAKKRYVHEATESRWLGLTDRIDNLFSYGQTRLQRYVSLGLEAPKHTDFYQDLSMQFFFRNVVAFEAAKRLSDIGYLCEVATILRSALEQFAFSANLWKQRTDRKLKSVRAVHSLNSLKQYVPAAGQLYGHLSKYTHFEFDHHTHFFESSGKQIFTVRRTPTLRAYATHLLLITMACISQYVVRVAPEQFGSVSQSVSELAKFIDLTVRYSDDVCLILPLDEVLANMSMLLQDIIRG